MDWDRATFKTKSVALAARNPTLYATLNKNLAAEKTGNVTAREFVILEVRKYIASNFPGGKVNHEHFKQLLRLDDIGLQLIRDLKTKFSGRPLMGDYPAAIMSRLQKRDPPTTPPSPKLINLVQFLIRGEWSKIEATRKASGVEASEALPEAPTPPSSSSAKTPSPPPKRGRPPRSTQVNPVTPAVAGKPAAVCTRRSPRMISQQPTAVCPPSMVVCRPPMAAAGSAVVMVTPTQAQPLWQQRQARDMELARQRHQQTMHMLYLKQQQQYNASVSMPLGTPSVKVGRRRKIPEKTAKE